MATTAMDYENPNGDRFEGKLLISLSRVANGHACVTRDAIPYWHLWPSTSADPRQTELTFAFYFLQTRDLATSATTAAPLPEATTATIAPVVVLLRPVATGKIHPDYITSHQP